MRVVVVDDDFMVARVHAGFVERVGGFTVVGSARSAAEAREVIAASDPDIVLLDIHLPDTDGLTLLRDLREEGVQAEVIMITAERDAASVREARHLGALHYLIKPFESEELAHQLDRAREACDLAAGQTEQAAIDRIFGGGTDERTARTGPAAGSPVDPASLPKGLSPETLALVEAELGRAADVSAGECAERTGLSRVTTRRYLEHLVGTGRARVRLQYGHAGRPERRYRLGE